MAKRGKSDHTEDETSPTLESDMGVRGSSGHEVEGLTGSLTLSSPSFEQGGVIPANHTADGANLAPALAWDGVPSGTKSLALLVEDPDAPDTIAPVRTFTHYIV